MLLPCHCPAFEVGKQKIKHTARPPAIAVPPPRYCPAFEAGTALPARPPSPIENKGAASGAASETRPPSLIEAQGAASGAASEARATEEAQRTSVREHDEGARNDAGGRNSKP